jgi:PAS domain S-box-containing protein
LTTNLTNNPAPANPVYENEERLRLAIEATGIGTWDVNPLTGDRRWSKEFLTICGFPPDTRPDPQLFSALIHQEDRDWVNERYRAAYAGQGGGRYEAQFRIHRASDGAERWVLIKGQITFAEAGPIRGVGTLLDVTDQNRTAQALAETEERYRLAVAAFHGATYETDLVTGYAYRAPRAYDMLGVRPELGEPTRDWWFSRIHPDDSPRFHDTLAALLEGRIAELDLEFRMRHENGTWIWVWQRGLAVRDAAGQVVKTVGALLEISSRKRAEAALRESEARFRHMADSAPALIWMTDHQAQVIFANMHFDYVFGRPAADMLGHGILTILQSDDAEAYSAAFADAFARRQEFRAELRARDRNDQVRTFRFEGVPRLDDSGGFLGYTGCALDVTDVALAQERQMLLINELNHRVKNTLATVQSIASQSLRNAASTVSAKQIFEERLMALSRAHDVLTRENWEGAALCDIIAQAIEPYRGQGESAFVTGGPGVWLPPTLALAFAMALQELVTNAIKYGALTRPEGRVPNPLDIRRERPPAAAAALGGERRPGSPKPRQARIRLAADREKLAPGGQRARYAGISPGRHCLRIRNECPVRRESMDSAHRCLQPSPPERIARGGRLPRSCASAQGDCGRGTVRDPSPDQPQEPLHLRYLDGVRRSGRIRPVQRGS